MRSTSVAAMYDKFSVDYLVMLSLYYSPFKRKRSNIRVMTFSSLVTRIKPQGGSRRENSLYSQDKKRRKEKEKIKRPA